MVSYPETYTRALVPPVHHMTYLLLISNFPLILPSRAGSVEELPDGAQDLLMVVRIREPVAIGAQKTYKISPLRGGDGSAVALSDGAQDLLMDVRM